MKQSESRFIISIKIGISIIIGYTSGGVPYGVTWEEMGIKE